MPRRDGPRDDLRGRQYDRSYPSGGVIGSDWPERSYDNYRNGGGNRAYPQSSADYRGGDRGGYDRRGFKSVHSFLSVLYLPF